MNSHRFALGSLLSVLGIGVAATALFGLPLSSQNRFDPTDYNLIHSVADLGTGRNGRDLLNGFSFWWDWARLAYGALLVVLAALLVAGVAQRALGIVLAVLTVVFGVVELIALAKTPTYIAIEQFNTNGPKLLGNASYGVWLGIVGLVVLVAGALVTALQSARPTPPAANYPPPPPAYQPNAPYAPPSDPTAKQL